MCDVPWTWITFRLRYCCLYPVRSRWLAGAALVELDSFVLLAIQRWLQARDCPTHVYVVVFMLISLACKRGLLPLGAGRFANESLCE
jgi:hypothetical protein